MPLTIFFAYIVTAAVGYWLNAINIRYLKRFGNKVPPGFEGAVDPDTLTRTTAYTLEKNRFGVVESVIDNALLLLFIFGGVLTLYDGWISAISTSFILSGSMFFLLLSLTQSIIGIPLSLFDTFRIENRYGFNTTTPGMWLSDLIKTTVIASILLFLVSAGGLAIVQWSPKFWWLWVWAFFAVVSLFLMYISPYVIEPLFNKFEPVKDQVLEGKIRELMQGAKFQVSRVMQMDASRRSRHSNAYFTGIGRVKRIVLYDTLLEQMTHEEVLAVLAHEVGHWKKGHIWKRLLLTELTGLAGCYLAFRLIQWGGLPGLLGLDRASFPAQLTILGFLGAIVSFPLTPFSSWLSRRQELDADRFASQLTGTPEALASSLVKLSRENLSNLHPHPLYAKFYYSHPPVVERVASLREMAKG